LYRMFALGLFFIVIMNLRPEGFGVGVIRHFRSRTGPRPGSRAPRAADARGERSPAAHPILEVLELTKRFGGLVAVDRVSFAVLPGTMLGIIGPNGAGKTTVLNTIAGVYAPTKGNVRFEGRSIIRWPPHRIARAGIGRTFQTLALWENLTLLDTVMLGRVQRLAWRTPRHLVAEHLGEVE